MTTSGVDPDLVRLAKRLKLGPILLTLPERLVPARAQQMDYVAFLTLPFADARRRPASNRRRTTATHRLRRATFDVRSTCHHGLNARASCIREGGRMF